MVFCDWVKKSHSSEYRLQECSGTVSAILEQVEKMIVTGQNRSLVNACVQPFRLSRCKQSYLLSVRFNPSTKDHGGGGWGGVVVSLFCSNKFSSGLAM